MQRAVRHQVAALERVDRTPVRGRCHVGVAAHAAVTGKVLARRRHPGTAHAGGEGAGEARDDGGVGVKRPVADDVRRGRGDVKHRRQAEVDAGAPELRRHHPARVRAQGQALFRALVVETPEHRRRRQPREALAKALHAPALLVHRHQQRRCPQSVNLGDERCQLRRRCVVAREQDHRTDGGMQQALAVGGRERRTLDVAHERTQWELLRHQARRLSRPCGARARAAATGRRAQALPWTHITPRGCRRACRPRRRRRAGRRRRCAS